MRLLKRSGQEVYVEFLSSTICIPHRLKTIIPLNLRSNVEYPDNVCDILGVTLVIGESVSESGESDLRTALSN